MSTFSENSQLTASKLRLPSETTLAHATRLAISEDKPILLDYWKNSIEGSAVVGVRENKEKLLVKSEDEYTSTIVKFYKSNTEYIIVTENSIYLVAGEIQTRKIS